MKQRRYPGVHAVITSGDLGEVPHIPVRLFPNPDMEPFRQPVLAYGKVRFVGEPMVLVVADSAAIAEDALELISVDIEQLPAVSDMESAKAGQIAAIRRAQAPTGRSNTTSRAATSTAYLKMPTMSGVSACTCIVTPESRWKHAAWCPSGTPRKAR